MGRGGKGQGGETAFVSMSIAPIKGMIGLKGGLKAWKLSKNGAGNHRDIKELVPAAG